MADRIPGQSGHRNGGRRPNRLSNEHMVTKLTRAIAREKVEYKDSDGPLYDELAQKTTYTRLELMIRVLFVMAEKGNLGAARLLAEIAEGKLARQVGETEKNDEGVKLTDEQMAELLEIALARLDEWYEEIQRQMERQSPPQSPPEQSG
jgi:hypothetical protein